MSAILVLLGATCQMTPPVMMWTPYECDREEYQDDNGLTKLKGKTAPS